MKILIDFLTVQVHTGAGEYQRRLFYSLVEQKNADTELLALYDSKLGIAYDDLQPEKLQAMGVAVIDLQGTSLQKVVNEQHIDKLFIACAQYVGERCQDVADLTCEVVCVVHDLASEELYQNHLPQYMGFYNPAFVHQSGSAVLRWNSPTMRFCRWLIGNRRKGRWEQPLSWMQPVVALVQRNSKAIIVAPSQYTKATLLYHWNIDPQRIAVYYSPKRIMPTADTIADTTLSRLVTSNTPYLLMVSAGREPKNPHKLVSAFKRYAEYHPEAVLLTVGYKGLPATRNHMVVPFLNDTDLTAAYQHCRALVYPSYFEGFGYPPLEAMSMGKPVLCSNVCSMPEVFGDAPLYFSPLYESDIFRALTLLDEQYEMLSTRSVAQYKQIDGRQESDLQALITKILS